MDSPLSPSISSFGQSVETSSERQLAPTAKQDELSSKPSSPHSSPHIEIPSNGTSENKPGYVEPAHDEESDPPALHHEVYHSHCDPEYLDSLVDSYGNPTQEPTKSSDTNVNIRLDEGAKEHHRVAVEEDSLSQDSSVLAMLQKTSTES